MVVAYPPKSVKINPFPQPYTDQLNVKKHNIFKQSNEIQYITGQDKT